MKSILLHIIFVKFKLANQNLDDNFVPFLSFFHFFPKWKGRKYYRGFYRLRKKHANPAQVCGIK